MEEEEKINNGSAESLGDEHHQEAEKRRRLKFIAVIATVFVLGGLLLFFDNILNYFTDDKPKSVGKLDKEGARISRMTEEQWKPHADQVKDLLEKGKVEEAADNLRPILSRNPGIPEVHYLAGIAFLRQGKIQGAYDQFKKAVALKEDYYEAQVKLGEIYLLAGDHKAARDISGKLAKGGEYLQDGLLLESEIAQAEGNFEIALQKASAALSGSKKPSDARLAAYLADLYLRKGDKGKAEKVIEKLNPATLDAEGLLSLAKFYLGAGNEAKAQAFFQQALTRYPDSAEANYNYAQYLFKKERFQDAAGYYKKAMNSMPDVQIIAYHMCQCYLATGMRDNAKAQIDAMARKYPDSLLTLGLKIQYHLLAGERKQVIDTLNRMIVHLPYAPRPYTILALLYWQDGIIPLAERNALSAIKLKESTVLPHMLMGDILSSKGDFKQALAYYERILEVQPDNYIALLQTGDLFLNVNEPKKAEERYKRALAANPRVRSIQTKIAWARAKSGDLEGALAMDRQYMKERPGDPQALSAYVNLLVEANRFDEAIDTVRGAVKKNPRDWPLHYLLGDLCLQKKDFQGASASYETALELNPLDVNMALNIGLRYEENAAVSEAEKIYLKFLKKMPNNPLAANQLAWLYLERMGSPQKAKEWVEILMTEKERPEMKDTIAWYYYKLGRFSEAENYFREALRLAPDRNASRARLALALYAQKKIQEAEPEAQKVVSQLPQGRLKDNLQEAMAKQRK